MPSTTKPEPTVHHETFCLPQASRGDGPATEPRIESYSAPRYGADGVTVVSMVRVARCLECGAATYTDPNTN